MTKNMTAVQLHLKKLYKHIIYHMNHQILEIKVLCRTYPRCHHKHFFLLLEDTQSSP